MKTSNIVDRRTLGNLVYTRKRRSFKVTSRKLEDLRESLVEVRETPAKGGKSLERRRGESELLNSALFQTLLDNK